MKTFLLLATAMAVFYIKLLNTRAQSMDDPHAHWKPMEFDQQIRGTWNMSYCIKSRMNCWEVVRPELFCRNYEMWPTICDIFGEYCSVYYDDLASYSNPLQTVEGYCDAYWLYSK